MYRHGDLLIKESTKKVDKTKKSNKLTLALGEATGHHHTLYADGFIYGDSSVFELPQDTPLRHQEHNEIVIEKGVYETFMEIEYDPFNEELKKVVD